ncbi:ubiA prenyltransferase family protein [Methyloversatilis sp. RAC08]|uniref:UbiA family prenyltransferase n=1 Tax=Methyloversatilis sp. RAC08 TaxID=1842540 RepID=UPI00083D75A7|nr:UbiA family prenyltransferase [Methyloversatilis sp. RAC08]AOF83414.1 ubiA prenyltransferase family protein [Methyloversatilis sp. RAC08]
MLHRQATPSTHHAAASSTASLLPLVVDLDGTLTHSDSLVESVVQVVKHSPLNLLRLPFWMLGGRASFKRAVATRTDPAQLHLPYRQALLEYLRQQRALGRKLVLATAAHESIAQRVASELDVFDCVLATCGGANLKGQAKLAAIREHVGDDFVYVGDSAADIPIWQSSRGAVFASVSSRTRAAVGPAVPIERDFPDDRKRLLLWLRALRVHQWTKNLLLFVPLLTAFSFSDTQRLLSAVLAFFAFSLVASATYMVNDILDLENDRVHPRKRRRPFASGQLSLLHGLAAAAFTLALGLVLAAVVSVGFLLMLLLYLLLTSAYSWVIKKYVLMDVLMLSLLYTLRILAGSVSVGIEASSWLLVFSVFIFLSLALVKRCAELTSLQQSGETAARGRDYRVSDLTVLWPMGIGAALSSVIVFGLFISSPDTQARYASPELLWLVELGLIYWLGRLWVKTSRNEMHDDPMVYAIRDGASRVTVALMLVVVLCAHTIALGDRVAEPAQPVGSVVPIERAVV